MKPAQDATTVIIRKDTEDLPDQALVPHSSRLRTAMAEALACLRDYRTSGRYAAIVNAEAVLREALEYQG